jgi:ABC-2 type transport system ATP-binding protein
VIEMAGLGEVADRRAGTFSLGMNQRLALAGALLGDPEVLILDEPLNGLDPEGVFWVRHLCRQFASEGRTVLISSHLMSEIELSADRLVILGRGRVLADAPLQDLVRATVPRVRVRSPHLLSLADELQRHGASPSFTDDGAGLVEGLTPEAIGDLAAAGGFAIHELVLVQDSLETVYLRMTDEDVEFRTKVNA